MHIIKYKIYKITKTKQWRLQYFLHGKRVRKNFKIKRDALNYIDEVKKNYNTKSESKKKMKTICYDYLALYPESKLMKTKWVYNEFLEEFGALKPAQITTQLLREWLLGLKSTHNLSNKSLSNYKSNLNAIFRYLVINRIINESPFDSISFHPYHETKKVLDDKYFEALWIYSPYFLYRIIWLEYHTGLSRKAVLNLKWSDSFTGFESDVRLFISLLPKRSQYVLVNRKGNKIDLNLARHRFKVFEKSWQSLKK